MLVEDAAKRLGMTPQTLRLALQQGVFPIWSGDKNFAKEIHLQDF